MVTIAHIVGKMIAQKPFIQEALSKGIINNAALAEQLQPEIEKELQKKVTFSAVNMAIRRLAEKLEKTFIVRAKFDQSSDITIQSDLVEITVYKTGEVQEYIKSIYAVVDLKKGDFLTITQGLHEIMFITNKRHEKKIMEILPRAAIKKIIRSLSSLTINIPITAIETMGFFYLITRALNWENINIIDIVSTLTEMTFIVKEDDTARAFTALKRLIENN
ncbi:hypothetical protein HY491_04270 [Candidatus Woesearchaeota archaeon]|nr:hypothetical protein [Candidatus Woesearchaeota archaeon]